MTMRDHVERYVMFRRHLGWKFVEGGRMLRGYAEHAMAHGERFAEVSAMITWASGAPSPGAMRRRLNTVRHFAIWLHAEDERHEVPPRDAIGREQRRRPIPHLLTVSEIGRLMEAALSLPPAGSITPHTYHCAIGLVAATGLRRSEATALRLTDITPDGLIVGPTKFGKHRLVALHKSTRDALERYLAMRERTGAAHDHLFVLSTGRPLSPDSLTQVFIKLARQIGLRGGLASPVRDFMTRQMHAIPSKRGDETLVDYLDRDEMQALLDAPDPTTRSGVRDRAMLHLAYAAGLRVSELTGLVCGDLGQPHLDTVHVCGKGRRERILPLWKETRAVLRQWLAIRPCDGDRNLFLNARAKVMSRHGFAHRLALHVATARQEAPSMTTKRISPHTLRHSCAMHTLEATGDIRKVSLWLGHQSIQSTEIYLRADPVEKLDILAAGLPPGIRKGSFRDAPDRLLAILQDAKAA